MIDPVAPPPPAKRLAVRVTPAAERNLRAGHPWLFESGITNLDELNDGRAGDLAVVFDRKRRFLAIGLLDPDSPIRVRVLHHLQPQQIDDAWLADRVAAALKIRQSIDPSQTTGLRLIYGEGDGLSGVILDQYGKTLVLKLYSAAWFPFLHLIANVALAHTGAERLVVRLARLLQQAPERCWGVHDGQVLWGSEPEGAVGYLENGLQFTADVIHGHKTGTFFDHRDNRRWVKNAARGRDVLDVFSYTGGFAVHAAAGGARSITAVDVSRPALDLVAHHLALNGYAGPLDLREGDAFAVLEQLAEQGRSFDFIIVDPPSFAKQQSEIEGAVVAYGRLTRLALALLRPAGVMVFASCSSRVRSETFFGLILAEAEALGRPMWVHKRTGHALDHPVRPEFPEGEYLKCLMGSPIDE